MPQDKLVIYHSPCPDGFCAAWKCWEKFGDSAKYLPTNYGKPLPAECEEEGIDQIWIVDFSYPRPILEELRRSFRGTTLRVLDHHKTAEADLQGLDFCEFDMTRSGAGLVADTFGNRDWVVDYVEDRDLWKFERPFSREVNAALQSWPWEFEVWKQHKYFGYSRALAEGTGIQRYIDRVSSEAVEHALQFVQASDLNIDQFATGESWQVPVINVSPFVVSETLHRILQISKVPIAVGWYQGKDGSYLVSLRSKPDFDCSVVAKSFGGGGHKNSSGFRCQELPWR